MRFYFYRRLYLLGRWNFPCDQKLLSRYNNIHICVIAGIDRPTRAVSLRSDRGSRAFPSLELDTVVEERSDPEQSTALELSSPD